MTDIAAATSLEDLNRREQNAIFSVIVTSTAIILILVGIYVFTRDISVLSSGLLRPLRLLADDMQIVTQMQLAGLQSNKAVINFDRNVAEIRLIEGIFEKTKTAIRSWGKYVPWPVVQILLAAGIDSALKLGMMEVTMFFSDIAGFTTIVEKLPPDAWPHEIHIFSSSGLAFLLATAGHGSSSQALHFEYPMRERSLVLLSRYFNDMSQVIDNHGGIVIEFIGDAILSVYGAPLRNPMHADAGVRATLKMLKALDRINAWSKHRSLPQVSIRCGVHTGEADWLMSREGGGQPAPDLCRCDLCLVIGRLSAFCHSGELGPVTLAFATDRLRILFNELLDARARAPRGIGAQPPAQVGVTKSDTPEPAEESKVKTKTESKPSLRTSHSRGWPAECRSPATGGTTYKGAAHSRGPKPPRPVKPQPPPPPPHWPTSTVEEAPAANSKATPTGPAPPPPRPSVTESTGAVPVKTAPRPPPAGSSGVSVPKAPLPAAVPAKEEDDYTEESFEEEDAEEDPEVESKETQRLSEQEKAAKSVEEKRREASPEPLERKRTPKQERRGVTGQER
eukprot:s180_g30.t1